MPKMQCRCDYVFEFDVETEDYEQCLFQLKFVEQVEDDLGKGTLTREEFTDRRGANGRDVCSCPECGRVYIETRAGSKLFESYIKEDGGA